ncbi:Cof-type HAD-IIB family hydrolase [Paenibacillus sp. GYB003]|jgi:HAD superfamily hydrolase (TIGR01484 family)|uniref:Cof-type HAD-IIB family hydrolase n=1 Tax=Paenibacillus sp. GYB003 TaxID=2994392 RepID=UPI002F96CD30
MKWKMLALDLDGTLLDRNGTVSEENAEWVRKAQRSGLHVVLVSGRHRLRMMPIVESLGLRLPIISTNGCEIWSAEGRLLDRKVLSWKDVEAVHLLAFRHNVRYRAYCAEGVFDSDKRSYLAQMDYSWLKVLLKSDSCESLLAAYERLLATDRLELIVYGAPGEPHQIDVQPKGTGKAAALDKLCRTLGIRRDDVVAIGDDRNDVDMLRFAGLGVAMANAPDDVRAAADAIAPHDLESGVGRTIASLMRDATA